MGKDGSTGSERRYGFIALTSGHMLAFPARPGAKSVLVGRQRLPARAPQTDLEIEAVAKLQAPKQAKARTDYVAIMARRIREAAGRGVERSDFRQAGVPDDLIDKHFDAAIKMARRHDAAIDTMGAAA